MVQQARFVPQGSDTATQITCRRSPFVADLRGAGRRKVAADSSSRAGTVRLFGGVHCRPSAAAALNCLAGALTWRSGASRSKKVCQVSVAQLGSSVVPISTP